MSHRVREKQSNTRDTVAVTYLADANGVSIGFPHTRRVRVILFHAVRAVGSRAPHVVCIFRIAARRSRDARVEERAFAAVTLSLMREPLLMRQNTSSTHPRAELVWAFLTFLFSCAESDLYQESNTERHSTSCQPVPATL